MRSKTINLFVLLCMFILLAISKSSSAVDNNHTLEDPLYITSTLFKNGVMLNYDNFEKYTCTEKIALIKLAKDNAKRIIQKKKKEGIDLYKQSRFDFSNLKYEYLQRSHDNAKVLISGHYIFKLDGTNFNYKGEVYEIHFLKKEDGRWKWCDSEKSQRRK